MKLSILGTGRMGKGLMKVMSPHYHVVWGTRDPSRVRDMIRELEYDASPADYESALEADVIFHSFWFRDIIPWAVKHRDNLRNKILVDITNPFTADFTDFTTEWGISAAEELQKVVPETKVVGAFKNTFWEVFNSPLHEGAKSDVYVTSDHEDAKNSVIHLLQPLPFRTLDAGKLMNNRTIERMTLFEREIAIRYGHYPHVSFRIWGGK